MVVTLSASHREAEKCGSGGGDSIENGFHTELLWINPSFLIDLGVSMKASRDELLLIGVRQQVSGKLFNTELIQGHVAIECLNDPITVAPHGPFTIDAVTIRIGVASDVEPMPSPALTIMGRAQTLCYPGFISFFGETLTDGL